MITKTVRTIFDGMRLDFILAMQLQHQVEYHNRMAQLYRMMEKPDYEKRERDEEKIVQSKIDEIMQRVGRQQGLFLAECDHIDNRATIRLSRKDRG